MNPLRVWARNYRSFPEVDLDLPEGLAAITGTNGAGKSSIISIIDIGLFGPESRSLDQYLADDADDDLELGLEFEHGGARYRVRRGYSARGRGRSTLDLEQWLSTTLGGGPVEGWAPMTLETVKDTQLGIERIVGLSRATWRASAYLAQGDGDAFTRADPRDRKAILSEILALHTWERLHEQAKGDRRAADNTLHEIAGSTDLLRELAAQRPEVEQRLAGTGRLVAGEERMLAAAEAEHDQAAAKAQEAEQAGARRQAAEAEHARAIAERDRLRQTQAEGGQAAADKTSATEQIASLATLDQTIELEQQAATLAEQRAAEQQAQTAHAARLREYDLKLTQRNAILGQASELNEQAHTLRIEADRLEAEGPGENVCSHCGQTLGAEALKAAVLSLHHEADEKDAAAKDLDQQAAGIELPEVGEIPAVDERLPGRIELAQQAVAAARRDQEQRARLDERLALLDEKIAAGQAAALELPAAERAVAAAEAALADLPPTADLDQLRAFAQVTKAAVDAARARLDTFRADHTRAQAELERIDDADAKLAEFADRTAELQARVDVLADAEKAYGRDGIPALLVENQAIPQIEVEANRILAELGTPYRVELRTQRALKSGDGLRDTLDVVIVTDHGDRLYETFSGGERTRIDLALRIALARLLARRRGAESRLLAIDEPDGLDADGFARLGEILRGLSSDFSRVYVISHHPDLRDAFDVTVEVVKEDGRSRLLLDTEAVAA